jgi:hypothetical protein
MPNVYTFGLQWLTNIEVQNDPLNQFQQETSREDIRRVFELLPATIDLSDFYSTSYKPTQIDSKVEKDRTPNRSSKYVLRGLVAFYGRHYMAYFYSEKHDAWFQFDDAAIREIGNWVDVKDLCIKGRQQPILVYYEQQEIIVNFLTQGGQLKHLPGYDKISDFL